MAAFLNIFDTRETCGKVIVALFVIIMILSLVFIILSFVSGSKIQVATPTTSFALGGVCIFLCLLLLIFVIFSAVTQSRDVILPPEPGMLPAGYTEVTNPELQSLEADIPM